MFSTLLCRVFLGLALACVASGYTVKLEEDVQKVLEEFEMAKKHSKAMDKRVAALSRQVMLQQLFIEERIRSEGQSGIKQIRDDTIGTKSYHSRSHTGGSVAAIHDHSNNIRTVGMGEFIAVLNGVEFRTRHNDYRLYMPSTTSGAYGAHEAIPFPPVPPAVTEKLTVKEQSAEMVEWFKAWRDSDHSKRDYRKHFKPVLCYLEGTWTKNTDTIDEPFESDRHFVDASSWFDLQEKIRFTSYCGRKENNENYAYLPTTIMEILNETTAVFAQWNYRIMCHPLKMHVPLNRLRMVDDIASRVAYRKTMDERSKTRGARFQVNPADSHRWRERFYQFNFLDRLMGEIPGKNNYPGKLQDDGLGQVAYSLDPKKPNEVLNAGYYHRFYKVLAKGAMGVQRRTRGYSDQSQFMALTTQDKVAGLKMNSCEGRGKNRVCKEYSQKWSYAIPLEIIYLTPLHSWNPYNLKYKGEFRSSEGRTVIANGRNGGLAKATAYDGLNSKVYYLTPNMFYAGAEANTNAADTTKGAVGVLDTNGDVKKVRASGTRIFLPRIPGIGILRQRYPIMPVHAEGSSAWRKAEAVQELLMRSKTNARLYREKLVSRGGTTVPPVTPDVTVFTGCSASNHVAKHHHTITLLDSDLERMKRGNLEMSVMTSQKVGHAHQVNITWDASQGNNGMFYIKSCRSTPAGAPDGRHDDKCWDHHPANLVNTLPAGCS